MTMVWLNWVAFEDGSCPCWCGEHHAKGMVPPSKCDGCGRPFTGAAVYQTVPR